MLAEVARRRPPSTQQICDVALNLAQVLWQAIRGVQRDAPRPLFSDRHTLYLSAQSSVNSDNHVQRSGPIDAHLTARYFSCN